MWIVLLGDESVSMFQRSLPSLSSRQNDNPLHTAETAEMLAIHFYTASLPTNKSTLEMKCYKISKSSVIYVISELLHLNQMKTSNRTGADITLKTLSSVHFRIGTTDTNNGT